MTIEPRELNVDLAVIGTGAAGSNVAFACRSAGWSVAIIDALPFGGTCQLRGCDPKKVLVAAEELVDWSRRFAAKGVVQGDLSIDWPGLMRFKTTFTAPAPQQNERAYAEAGIAMSHGRARFVGAVRSRSGQPLCTRGTSLLRPGLSRKRWASRAKNF